MLCLVSGCKSTRRLCRGCVGILKKGLRLEGCLPLHITNGMQPSLKTPRATPRKGRNKYLCGVKPINTQSHDYSDDCYFDYYRSSCFSRLVSVLWNPLCNRWRLRWRMPEIPGRIPAQEICEEETEAYVPFETMALLRWLKKCPFPTQTACVILERIQTTHAVFLWTQKKSKK